MLFDDCDVSNSCCGAHEDNNSDGDDDGGIFVISSAVWYSREFLFFCTTMICTLIPNITMVHVL